MAKAEAKVETFRSKNGLIGGLSGTGTSQPIGTQQLTELSTQLTQARAAQADAAAKAKLIRDLIKDGRAFEIPDVANNELIRRLVEQRITLRAQLALESRTLLPQLAVPTEAPRARLKVRAFATPVPHRTITLVWRKRSSLADALRSLARTIREAYPGAGTEPPTFGFLGRPRVNVLELNLALDAALGAPAAPVNGK